MSRRFPPEVHAFIRDHVAGITSQELLDLVTAQFGPIFTASQLKAYKTNHKLRGGVPKRKKPGEGSIYPEEIHTYIRENYKGTGPSQMQKLVNEKFGTQYTAAQLKSYYARYHLNSGVTGRFARGQVPPNKGQKGHCAPGCEKGWFQKGNDPVNTQPVGTVQVKADGYLWKKMSDTPYQGIKNWKQLHRLLWEEARGPIPEGHLVVFRDGDKTHCTLDNLALISKADNAVLNHLGLRPEDPDYFESGLLVAKIKSQQSKLKRNRKRS